MLLSELISEVYIATNRPDLVAETSSAVRAATLFAHHTDFYTRDLLEGGLQFDTAEYQQSLEVSIIPNYRKIKYLRFFDAVDSEPGNFMTILTSDETLDDYGVNKENIAYEAGSVINIRSNLQIINMLFGAYVSPNVTSLNWNSWIADNFPFLIVYNAARKVYQSIGNLDMARVMKEDAAEQFTTFRLSALATVGE